MINLIEAFAVATKVRPYTVSLHFICLRVLEHLP